MEVFVLSALSFNVVLGILWYQRHRKYSKLPPGPGPLLLLGNTHQMKSDRLHLDITEIGRKYGDIFTVYFLAEPVVILNSVAVIREGLQSPEYDDVFSVGHVPFVGKKLFPNHNIGDPDMEKVQFLRNLFFRSIKQYSSRLENVVHHTQMELAILIENLRTMNGQPVDPSGWVNQYAVNIQMMLIVGNRFPPSHDAIRIAAEDADDVDNIINYKKMFLLDLVPQHVLPVLNWWCKRVRQNKQYLAEAVDKLWTETGESENNSLYSLLSDEEKRGRITEKSKQRMVLDALQTGVITVKPVILMVLASMGLYPDVQTRVQEEIDKVVGKDRLPCLDDKPNLPYTQAVLLETMRLFSPVPLPGPRITVKDCTYKGYFIPEGTQVTYNVWHINHDESFWEDPFEFDPSRFLDQDGNVLPPEHEKRRRLMTFGLGKRACAGEVLAWIRIFLAVTGILQTFDLKRDPEHPFLSSDPRDYPYSYNMIPPAYELCFVPRM